MTIQNVKRGLMAFGCMAGALALSGFFGTAAMAQDQPSPANPHKETIVSAAGGNTEARATLVALNYKSPQQVLAGFNQVVVARGGAVKAANFRQENKHNNFLDGGSLSLYVGDANDPRSMNFFVDIKVYADANLNTVVNAKFKVNNSEMSNEGQGMSLRKSLEDEIGISRRFNAQKVPAFIWAGDFRSYHW